MTKKELTAAIVEKTGFAKGVVEQTITAMVEEVEASLEKGEKVQLVGFGVFDVQQRSERVCKNLHTGEIIYVKSMKVPHFKAGKKLKEMVRNS